MLLLGLPLGLVFFRPDVFCCVFLCFKILVIKNVGDAWLRSSSHIDSRLLEKKNFSLNKQFLIPLIKQRINFWWSWSCNIFITSLLYECLQPIMTNISESLLHPTSDQRFFSFSEREANTKKLSRSVYQEKKSFFVLNGISAKTPERDTKSERRKETQKMKNILISFSG